MIQELACANNDDSQKNIIFFFSAEHHADGVRHFICIFISIVCRSSLFTLFGFNRHFPHPYVAPPFQSSSVQATAVKAAALLKLASSSFFAFFRPLFLSLFMFIRYKSGINF